MISAAIGKLDRVVCGHGGVIDFAATGQDLCKSSQQYHPIKMKSCSVQLGQGSPDKPRTLFPISLRRIEQSLKAQPRGIITTQRMISGMLLQSADPLPRRLQIARP